LNKQGIKTSRDVLLHLLWGYAEILKAQDETYKTYITTKLDQLEAADEITQDALVTAIDNEISGSAEQRQQHEINAPHNPLGSFQA